MHDLVKTRAVNAGRTLLLVVLLPVLAGCDRVPIPPPVPTAAAPVVTPAPPTVPAISREPERPTVPTLPAPTLAAATPTTPPRPPVRPQVGYTAPGFSLTNLQGGTRVRLSDLAGQPVWLNFWATTCPPCLSELPTMQKAHNQYADRVVMISVSLDDSYPTVRRFLDKYGYNWVFAMDEGRRMMDAYGPAGIPTHYFIRPDGIISKVAYGELSLTQMNGYLGEILD